jgi:hypothetical protein
VEVASPPSAAGSDASPGKSGNWDIWRIALCGGQKKLPRGELFGFVGICIRAAARPRPVRDTKNPGAVSRPGQSLIQRLADKKRRISGINLDRRTLREFQFPA